MPIQPDLPLFPRLDLSPETLLRMAWRGRCTLLAVVALSAGLGIGIALLTLSEFRSEARIIPEMETGPGDTFRRLASVTGFGGIDGMVDNDGMGAIRPDLYPSVIQSTPFILYLLDQPVTTVGGRQTTVGTVLMPDEGFGWWLQTLFSASATADSRPANATPAPGRPVKLSERQQELAEDIGKRVSARLDTRSGVITISAKMPDASIAAAVAQLTMNYLTEYVTNYRTEKARMDLNFYSLRLTEARQRYQKAQINVFSYNDQHKYLVVVLQAATMDKQRMDAELSIAQAVYADLSQQFEQAKLRVQERTPVFKVLEPANVPLKRVSPKRAVIVLGSMLAGLTLGIGYLMVRQVDWAGRMRGIIDYQNPTDLSVG